MTMTEAEQDRIIVQTAEELKAEKRRLVCLERKAEKIADGLRQMIEIVEGRSKDYDIHPEGRVRVGFESIYVSEEEIVSVLKETEACRKKIAKLQNQWDAFGLT